MLAGGMLAHNILLQKKDHLQTVKVLANVALLHFNELELLA
jgi:hypothetical protein